MPGRVATDAPVTVPFKIFFQSNRLLGTGAIPAIRKG